MTVLGGSMLQALSADCNSSSVLSSHRDELRVSWRELLTRVPWSYFVTLTYDPKRFPRSGPESWLKSWRWFLFAWMSECAVQSGQCHLVGGRLRGPWINALRHGRAQPMWILALEPHRDDRLHAHVLLLMTRHQPWLDYTVGQRIWQENRGFCWFEKPRSLVHVSDYLAKYVTKLGPDAIVLSPNFDAARMASC